MKKKLSRIAAMLLAVMMVITGVAFMPKVEAEAADIPSFTVRTDATELHPGDTVHVQLYLEPGIDLMMMTGSLDFDPDVYEFVQGSMQYNFDFILATMGGGLNFVDTEYVHEGYITMLYQFVTPQNQGGVVFEFDLRVKDDASGMGEIIYNFVTGDVGPNDEDVVELPEGAANVSTVDGNGNIVENGEFPIVINLENFVIDQDDFTMARGATDTLTVTATPEAALAGKTVTWSSTDDSVVKVDQEGNIEAVGIGTAMITASVDDFSDSVAITVNSPLTGIELNTQETSIKKGETAQLEVIYTPADTTDDTTVIWSSSDEDIASVDENGVVTAKQDGTATITAAVGELTAECVVHVREVPLEDIDLDRTAITMNKGEVSEALQVSYNPEDTTDDKTVTWSSSDEDVATVDNGVVTAVGAGNATITATVGEFTAECEVTVVSSLESITLTADRTTDDLEVFLPEVIKQAEQVPHGAVPMKM